MQSKWQQNIDQCLKHALQEFLKNSQFNYILQHMTHLLQENKVVEAYSYCTGTSEYFRIKSKASLFLELRELLEPVSSKVKERRWNKQLSNTCSWFDIKKDSEDIVSCLNGLLSSGIQITQPNTVNQYSLQSKNAMVRGLALHAKYAVPIAKRILQDLISNHEDYEVWEPGRLIHPTMYFMACTPDVIISHKKVDFYRMIDNLHAQHPLTTDDLHTNALQAVFELKTFHKSKISKQVMNNVLDSIRVGGDGVKKELVNIITDMAVKQKITPTKKTREMDFKHRTQTKNLNGLSKTFTLYPTEEFLILDAQTIPTTQLGFIPKNYKKDEWPMENLCSEKTIGRAWVFVYDPQNMEDFEPTYVFSYKKSPFMLLPKSKVYRQMLEQRCVVQRYNSDAMSVFIGMFCVDEEVEDTKYQEYRDQKKVSPGIVLVIETKIHSETTRAFEECALIELFQRYPQTLGAENQRPMCELTDMIHSLVWSAKLEKETSYGLGNYNPEKDLAQSVLGACFV